MAFRVIDLRCFLDLIPILSSAFYGEVSVTVLVYMAAIFFSYPALSKFVSRGYYNDTDFFKVVDSARPCTGFVYI